MDLANMPIDISNFPEIEENRYHPMNDRFNQEISHVQKIIMAHQRSMKPKPILKQAVMIASLAQRT
jgi:hypothetical protein